ncbi:unnamed protein product [Nezara viridula]|uniref:CRAL-TRIO domain-containing protein n=1 Tax=Nezara viridula TaxID=85310 RepID=A0A9P0MP97_NEZVI|nr:unnamed protein product [Nezara viridula]
MVEEISNKRSKEAVEEDVQRLRDWLDKQPHLPHDVEHVLLLAFVYGTKTLEAAKRKLDKYYSNRNRMVKIYDQVARDVNARFRETSRAANQFFLSNNTPKGYKVFFVSMNDDCFTKVFDHMHEVTRMLMLLELRMKRWPDLCGAGTYIVYDSAGMSSTEFSMLSPTAILACLNAFQEGYPVKLNGCFCINAPSYVEILINNLIKPAVKAKIFDRIKVVNEGASFLKNYMPLEMLPSDYGGNDKSSTELNDYWMDQLEENREWFLQTTKHVSDEKKRPPDSQNSYGIDGTFRKLAVD